MIRLAGRLCGLLALGALAFLAAPVHARTITLTTEDCDQMAILSAKVPRLGWAGMVVGAGAYGLDNSIQLFPDMAVLLRYPLDQVPKGQRITKAELTLSIDYVAGNTFVSVRRLLAEWGTGVCHQYRMAYPKKIEWASPGGRGSATDRAAKDTALFRFEKVGELTVDVTEDVELWYTGATVNRGWILAIENSGVIYMPSPHSPGYQTGKKWKLQITFEPQ